jgi:hypothetical protein
VAVILGVLLCVGLLSILLLRHLRVLYDEPKYIPTKYLKDQWRNWLPSSEKKKRYSSTLQRRSVTPGQMSVSQLNLATAQIAVGGAAGATVDRHTSVRSTITLPSYTPDPRDTESVMGQAGERAGDTIIEFPETIEEEETRRDEEMEGLYQIRQARRDERDARLERSRLRQEAERTGDQETLRALREAAQAARRGEHLAAQRSAEDLIREHRSRERTMRIPEVDYAAVGIARHDGSRIRASSTSSDNQPLLDEAASMGNGGRPRAGTGDSNLSLSGNPGRRFFGHIRNISQSSLRRFATADSSDDDERRSDDDPTPRALGTPASVSATDLSEPSIPRTPSGRVIDPPQYNHWNDVELATPAPAATRDVPRETPPSYPWLPNLAPLPTIEITPYDTTHN